MEERKERVPLYSIYPDFKRRQRRVLLLIYNYNNPAATFITSGDNQPTNQQLECASLYTLINSLPVNVGGMSFLMKNCIGTL